MLFDWTVLANKSSGYQETRSKASLIKDRRFTEYLRSVSMIRSYPRGYSYSSDPMVTPGVFGYPRGFMGLALSIYKR